MSTLASVATVPLYPVILFAIAVEYCNVFFHAFSFRRYMRTHFSWINGPMNLLSECISERGKRTETLLAAWLAAFGLFLSVVPTETFIPLARFGMPLAGYSILMVLVGGGHLVILAWAGEEWRVLGVAALLFLYVFLNVMCMLTGVAPLAGINFAIPALFSFLSVLSLRDGTSTSK